MSSGPICSVVIPTHGLAPHLDEVLEALARQTRIDFEILIVDNNPAPRIRVPPVGRRVAVIHEPRPGASAARNAGVARVTTPCVAFLDDDSVPEPSWLATLVGGLERYAAAAAGGAVVLGLTGEPPPWLDGELRPLLSELRYDGIDVPSLPRHQSITGGNMSVLVRVFHEVGGFRETFGRVGPRLRASQEVEWCCRARAAGYTIAFIAAARVEHRIAVGQLRRRYVLRRGYWQGRCDALLEWAHQGPAAVSGRTNLRNARALLQRAAALLAGRQAGRGFMRWVELARHWGYCLESASLRRRQRPI